MRPRETRQPDMVSEGGSRKVQQGKSRVGLIFGRAPVSNGSG